MNAAEIESVLAALYSHLPYPWYHTEAEGEVQFRPAGAEQPSGLSCRFRQRTHSVTAEISPDRIFTAYNRDAIAEAARSHQSSSDALTVDQLGRFTDWRIDEQGQLFRVTFRIEERDDRVAASLALTVIADLVASILHDANVLEPVEPGSSAESDDQNVDPVEGLPEGALRRVVANRYERNPRNRVLALLFHGFQCKGCGLKLEDQYGPIASGRIHVHHIVPVSELPENYVIDPKTDLIPLCPNCHFVCHLREPPYTVAELRQLTTRFEPD